MSQGGWLFSDRMPDGSEWPKITIVTPSFNQGLFIEETICSVLNQNYPNLEYIIMDGGSTDKSAEIIKKYEDQLTYWTSEKDGGQYDAINRGLSRGTGEIMAWLNSDDIYCPWTLRTVAEVFSEQGEVSWLSSVYPGTMDCAGHCIGFNKVKGFSKEAFLDGAYLPGRYKSFNFIQQESTFWKRSLWEQAHGLDTSFKMAGDFDLWGRFYRLTSLFGVHSPLACFRLQEEQKSIHLDEYFHEAEMSLVNLRQDSHWKPKSMRQLNLRYLMKVLPLKRILERNFFYQGAAIYKDNPRLKKSKWAIRRGPFFFY